jgi:hypothetical protein
MAFHVEFVVVLEYPKEQPDHHEATPTRSQTFLRGLASALLPT